MKSKLLMVIGAQKTSTSTMVGMLNCHPQVFMMHEWFVDLKPTKYGNIFYNKYQVPSRERVKKNKPIPTAMNNIRIALENNGISYEYYGDKWPKLHDARRAEKVIQQLKHEYVIFMVRDVRTWLAHPVVVSLYGCKNDVRAAVRDYVYYFVSSFLLENCLRIRAEDLIANPDEVAKSVGAFLELKHTKFIGWWDKVGKWDDKNKIMHKWWKRHRSALAKPTKQDISVTIKNNKVWDCVLPIFDKYHTHPKRKFKREEIENDLKKILELDRLPPTPICDCFEEMKKEKIY